MIRVFFISKMRRDCIIVKLWGWMMTARQDSRARADMLVLHHRFSLSHAIVKGIYIELNPLNNFAGILLSYCSL